MKRTRMTSVAALAAMIALRAYADNPDPGVQRMDLSAPWSLYDANALASAEMASRAERTAVPALAGKAALDAARALPISAAARIEGEQSIGYRVSLFGAYEDGAMLAGNRLAAGASWRIASLAPFVRLDAVYDGFKDADGNGSLDISASATAGLAGGDAFPFVVACSTLFSSEAVGPEIDAMAEVSRVFGIFGIEGRAAVAARSKVGFAWNGTIGSLWTVESRLDADGMDYVGAFGEGVRAYAFASASYDALGDIWGAEGRLGAEASFRLGDKAGASGGLDFYWGSKSWNRWNDILRGIPRISRPVDGDAGAVLRLGIPVIFARGKMLTDPSIPVDFTLEPFADLAIVRGAAGFFDRSSLAGAFGAELEMALPRSRRDGLRIAASFDASEYLRGDASPDLRSSIAASFVLGL